MRLIGLHGKAGAGKDTVADFLCFNYTFARYAFADPIKRGLLEMLKDFVNRESFDIPALKAQPTRGRDIPARELSHHQVADHLRQHGHGEAYIRSYLNGRRQVIK